MWDVGNFLLDPPSEQNNRDHREDEQENNKEETKKEPKVNCLAHYYLSPLPIFFIYLFFFTSPCISHSGKTWVRKPLVLLRHKLYEILPSVTSLERSVSRNVFVAASVAQSRIKATISTTKTLRDVFTPRGNVSCNFCRNGSTKVRDRLQEKLPSVTVPYLSSA